MRKLLFASLLVLVGAIGASQCTWAAATQTPEATDISYLDRLNNIRREAIKRAMPPSSKTTSREVKRGAKPEIVVQGGSFYIDNRAVRLGGPISDWKAALPGLPRCLESLKPALYCIWDDLGITIITFENSPHSVEDFIININPQSVEMGPLAPHEPKGLYRGYLELGKH